MTTESLGTRIAPHLPFVRRYARALSGNQREGDNMVRIALEAIVAAPEAFPNDGNPRLHLYRVFETFWQAGQDAYGMGENDDSLSADIASRRLSKITPRSRRALLLTTLEGFSDNEAAALLDTDAREVRSLVDEALAEIDRQTSARVLIIEDEPIIAMDIEMMVVESGHEVVAMASTRHEAVASAREHRPTLVLADIQLADNSSGIDAVNEILADGLVPVIFITAFPERLLTGEKPEPAFLITKPFQRDMVKAAIAQALFFNTATAPA